MTRLFHTVIISSSALLAGVAGCGATSVSGFDSAVTVEDAAISNPDVPADNAAMQPDEAVVQPDVVQLPDTQDVPTDTAVIANDAVDVAGDRRCLEEGWPTTKGFSCSTIDESTRTVRCCYLEGTVDEHCQTAIIHPDGCVELVEGQ